MANVKFSRKVFEKEIGKIDDKMAEKIALFGTPVESVSEEEIELEIFPNRPDLLSYHGFRRSFLSFIGKTKGIRKYEVKKPEKDYKVLVDSSLKNIRPFTACAIVKNLSLDDEKIKEIIDMQEKLHSTLGRKRKKLAIGIYPLEEIRLPIRFTALDPEKIKFVPLESEREMTGFEILEKHPTGKQYAHLLAGKQKFPVFVDAENKILSMPPVINSKTTGRVTQNTKDVFVECSGFDMEVLKKTLVIIVTSLSEMGGEIYQMEISGNKKEVTPDITNERIKVTKENIEKLIGINLNEKELEKNLQKMGMDYEKGTAIVPSWRTDILHEVDIGEEIGIALGYENFIPEIPKISTIGSDSRAESVKKKVSEILVGLGMLETSSFHLTTKDSQFMKMGLKEKEEKFVEVKDSKTEYNILRKDLSHWIMKIFSENVDSEYPQKIFQMGKVFGLKLEEKERLAGAINPGNFTEIKQALIYLSKMLSIEFKFSEPKDFPPYFIDGRVIEISYKDKKIGFAGEIHPRILKNWRIRMPVALFEISLDEILEDLVE